MGGLLESRPHGPGRPTLLHSSPYSTCYILMGNLLHLIITKHYLRYFLQGCRNAGILYIMKPRVVCKNGVNIIAQPLSPFRGHVLCFVKRQEVLMSHATTIISYTTSTNESLQKLFTQSLINWPKETVEKLVGPARPIYSTVSQMRKQPTYHRY